MKFLSNILRGLLAGTLALGSLPAQAQTINNAGATSASSAAVFSTAAAAAATALAGLNGFSTLAFATAGDGGQNNYIKATDGQTFTCDIVSVDTTRFHPVADIDPRICGAKPDLVTVANVDMSGSTITVHSSTISTYGWPGFVAADVGKSVAVGNAGPAVAAKGIIRVTNQPSVSDTCTVNGRVETAVASGAAAHQFNIGAGINETATNLAAVLTTDTASAASTATAVNNEVRITANATGTGGNAITVACSSGTVDAPKIEALQTFLAGGATASEWTGTITGVTSNLIATVNTPATAPVTSSYMDYGTDNATALNNALALTGNIDATDQQHFFTSGYYWGRGGRGSAANGPRRVVMRCVGRPNCVYGVKSEIDFSTGGLVDFQEEAEIAALPGFSGDAVVGTAQESNTYHLRVSNLHVDAHRRVANGLWVRSCSYCEFGGRTFIQGADRIAVHLGASEASGNSDRTIVTHFERIYAAGQTGASFAPQTNNPAGYAFLQDDNASDTTINVLEAQCYRTGYVNLGSAMLMTTAHVWTATACGPMNTGFDLRSNSDHINVAYADSPSNDVTDPTSVSGVGFLLRGRTMLDQAQCYLNASAAAIPDNDITCINVVYQGGSGPLIWSDVRVATSSSSFKYKTIVSYAAADAVAVANGLKARQNFNVRRVGLPSSTAYLTGYTSQDQLAEGPSRIVGGTQYYPFPGATTLASGTALTNTNLYLWLSCVSRPTQVGRLVARVSTADAAPGHFEFYIYAADTTIAGWPPTGTPILQSTAVSEATATTVTYDPSPNLILQQGCYWVGGQQDLNVAALTSLSSSSVQQQMLIGATTTGQLGSSGLTAGRSYVSTYGAATNLTGATGTDLTSAQAPMVWFRPQ